MAGYILYKKNNQNPSLNSGQYLKYTRKKLELMTNHQLREICIREKLVENMLGTLERHELIELIMRYRGAPENLFIKKECPGGNERLEKLIGRLNKHLDESKTIKNPSRIVVYEGLDTDKYDYYVIDAPGLLEESNVLLVSGEKELCAIFNLIADRSAPGRFFLTQKGGLSAKESKHKHYSLLYFSKADSENIFKLYYDTEENSNLHIPKNIKYYKVPLLNFEIKKPIETNQTLAIDFGSANTAAGVYIDRELYKAIDKGGTQKNLLKPDEINLVEVFKESEEYYETNPNETLTPLIPSVVGIWNIPEEQDEKIEYLFGHEAVKLAGSNFIHKGFCVFFDIKRWVKDYERQEEIIDINGRRTFKSRKKIIQAFFEYVISVAEQRFKCRFKKLHISSPLKEKERFRELFSQILPSWQIDYDIALDEGSAVIFNNIDNLIKNNPNQHIDKGEYQALVIDCGGGTTDVSSCKFSIQGKRVSYKIEIETTYENGDANFGGNNLTFRIMQLIKIALAKSLPNLENLKKMGTTPPSPLTQAKNILSLFEGDLFRRVDREGIIKVYRELDQVYEEMESIIPTKFKNYESGGTKDYFKVKNNFYFLFQLADRIKRELFSTPRLEQVVLTNETNTLAKFKEHKEDFGDFVGVAKTINVGYWRISVYEKDVLTTIREIPETIFTTNDLNLILKADIYEILRKFIEESYTNELLLDYDIIRLTGQSCKIALFKDALKEFIPGRKIEVGGAGSVDSQELKLLCLKGAIKYLRAKKEGHADVSISHLPSVLPYILAATTHFGEEKIFIAKTNDNEIKNTAGNISRFVAGEALKIKLKDMNGQELYTYVYENRLEDFEPVTYQDIFVKYGNNIIQDETDNIVNDEIKFFIWLKEDFWGFMVVPVLRQNSNLYLGREELFAFENDLWEINFFDGLK